MTDGKGESKGAASLTLTIGDLIDPWGNMYYVRIDTNIQRRVEPIQRRSHGKHQ